MGTESKQKSSQGPVSEEKSQVRGTSAGEMPDPDQKNQAPTEDEVQVFNK